MYLVILLKKGKLVFKPKSSNCYGTTYLGFNFLAIYKYVIA